MFQYHFDALRRKKAFEENRDLPLRVIAAETNLSINTIQKLRSGEAGSVSLSTVEAVLKYFGAQKINDLVEYVPEDRP